MKRIIMTIILVSLFACNNAHADNRTERDKGIHIRRSKDLNHKCKGTLSGIDVSLLSREVAEDVRGFHRTLPEYPYSPTPCVRLSKLAHHLIE